MRNGCLGGKKVVIMIKIITNINAFKIIGDVFSIFILYVRNESSFDCTCRDKIKTCSWHLMGSIKASDKLKRVLCVFSDLPMAV